ncbi:hypothetical protein LWI28_028704 [Acer negundo]|uniref:Reverse transcriptase Ty1/copia-type domain-containing protein n=1 Tax=Acer negundo TaxID=4023 RepID=A0AAD5NKY6_ACENE|nr:hypothetical protein LWI28_028704 [Acer negundo]
MDITFIENQSYYPKTNIQGGIESQESQFWETLTTEFFMSPSPSPTKTLESHSHMSPSHSPTKTLESHSQILLDSNSPESVSHQSQQNETLNTVPKSSQPRVQKELIVYTRKKSNQTGKDNQTHPRQTQEPEPNPLVQETDLNTEAASENISGNIDSNPSHAEIEFPDIHQPIALRKGVRECRDRPLYPMCNFISYEGLSPSFRTFALNISSTQIPNNIQEALKVSEWRAAVWEEVRALEKNGTWEMSELPKGKNPVGCKWIFTVKHKADGSVERFKARLVAKGFTQSYGIDYEETFAPVAKLNTIRVLLSLAANLDWPLHQLDVKNAFLNGDLEEEVYMEVPPGLETYSKTNLVCKLKKSLYGLKQSPRAWFERFTKAVKRYGYSQCQTDHTLFVKHETAGKMAILIVYVDDIILTGNYDEEIQRLKVFLAKEFEIKDLGNLKYFLGMEVARSKKGIVVSQRKYILDLLRETKMLECKPAETPMDHTIKLGTIEGSAPVDKGRYQRLVGKLIYLSLTRPDIGFSVSKVSQFMNKPTEEHQDAVFRILRYLKMTPGKGLYFKRCTNRDVEIFSDADWAGSATDRRSTSGYCTYVRGNLVTWRSKKQSVVSRSSAEAEFRAMAHGICEGIWLRRLLTELKVPMEGAMRMFCDNQAAISIAKNPVHHDRTKHVEIDRHFIKEKLEEGSVKLIYTPTALQTADILTKALPRANFDDMSTKLGMINIYNPA